MPSLELNKEIDVFLKFYNEKSDIFKAASEYFRSIISLMLLDGDIPIQEVICRVKQKDECISKFQRKYQEKLEEEKIEYEISKYITDIIGIRIVCLYEPDINTIRGILEKNFLIITITDKIKDIDSTENTFGYKSLHLDLKLNEDRKNLPENKEFADLQFEVQIRTIIQDAWSVLDHKIKYKKNLPTELKRRINSLAALFELADDEFYRIKNDSEKFELRIKESNSTPEQILNIFSFMEIVNLIFPTYLFIDYKADGFVHELLKVNNKLKKEEFKSLIGENISTIKKYNNYIIEDDLNHYLNPYTMIRHCLYLSDKEKYNTLLFSMQKENFNSWIKSTAGI